MYLQETIVFLNIIYEVRGPIFPSTVGLFMIIHLPFHSSETESREAKDVRSIIDTEDYR